jgi:hypothetical protein
MLGMFVAQHCEEVEFVFYLGWALVVLVIMSILGHLYSNIVGVVV